MAKSILQIEVTIPTILNNFMNQSDSFCHWKYASIPILRYHASWIHQHY